MPDGIRLDECFRELCTTLADRPRLASDGNVYRLARGNIRHRGDNTISQTLITREVVQSIAEAAIRNAAISGELDLWFMFDNVPAKVDHHEAHVINRNTLTLGWNIQSTEPPSALDNRPYWVHTTDWHAFKKRFMSAREGVHWSDPNPPVQPFNDVERAQWIREQAPMKVDDAFKLYRKTPRHDGTKQPEFRNQWREIRGTKRGRPRR